MLFSAKILFISSPEILVIIVIAVMLFGAKKIPEVAHGLGKGLRQVKNATNEIKSEIQKSADEYGGITKDIRDVKEDISGIKKDIQDATNPVKRVK